MRDVIQTKAEQTSAETNENRIPEAYPHCLLEASASGNCAGGARPKIVPPAPFTYIPEFVRETPSGRDTNAGRAKFSLYTRGTRGLPFPDILSRVGFRNWREFLGDLVGVASLFIILIGCLFMGAVLS